MKHIIRIPTVEYGYIEAEFEGTPEEAYEKHNELLGICRAGVGLPEKEWRQTLDFYLMGGGCTPEVYYKMNGAQQTMISELKKSFTRMGIRGEDITK